jgi:hypothetical protein
VSGAAADPSRVADDFLNTWWNLPRAVEMGGTVYYGGIRSTGQVAVVVD